MIEGSVIFEGTHNGTDILVRYARRDDVEILREFINTLSTEQTYITFQGEQVSVEDESRYIEDFLKKTEEHKAVKLLAFHAEELVGVCDIAPREKIESHIGVLGLTIKKEWRNKKIGSFLLVKTLEEAQKNISGMTIVVLGVFANNPVAKRLYETMGFKEYGVLPGGIQHKGELVDHIFMYKLVSP